MTDLVERVRQQVGGMFARNDYQAEILEDGSGYRVVTGSTETVVDFEAWNDDVVITLNAVLLADVQRHGRARTVMLERLNELNRTIPLGKVYLTEADPEGEIMPMIQLEYQLLGQNLDLTEFFGALEHVAFLAEDLDDQLKAEFGGHVFFEEEGEDAVDA